MRIALGMIVRDLVSAGEILRFVDNAESHGHKLDCVIITYNRHIDVRAVKEINSRVPLFTIDTYRPNFCYNQFRRRGMSDAAYKALLECPVDPRFGLVPYSYNRNLVVMEAMLRGIDVLFFTDNDVFPKTLKPAPGGFEAFDIDFFGAHLAELKSGSAITTGEYSGYNILPMASFDGMEDLLHGLDKGDMSGFWQS